MVLQGTDLSRSGKPTCNQSSPPPGFPTAKLTFEHRFELHGSIEQICKWTHATQTHVVQRAAVFGCSDLFCMTWTIWGFAQTSPDPSVLPVFFQCNTAYQCLLIADQHCRTRKYFLCLASGIPCVSHVWVHDSCHANQLQNYRNYLLPAGYSLEEQRILDW